VVVVAAWLGHKDATLTMRLYAHSQDAALKAAGATLHRVCHRRVKERAFRTPSNGVSADRHGADDGNRTRVFSLGS
jgi:hypothetical protein